MKGFKNLVVLLISALAFALATPKASAVAISDSPSFLVWNRSCQWTLNYRVDKNGFNKCGDWTRNNISISFSSSNNAPYNAFINNNTSTSWGSNTTLSYFWQIYKKDGYLQINTYNLYYDLVPEYVPFAGVSENFDGQTVLLNNIWFWNNFFVLYDDNLTHTLQYIWNYKIKDYIIFVDPLTSSLESSSYDNFYLISIPQKKAWSMKLVQMHLDNIFYGALADYEIKNFPFVNSYTLTQTTNTTIFPKYSNYMSNSTSYVPNDIWFIYTKDLEYIAPNFWWSNNNNTDTENWVSNFNVALVNDYNDCVNKWENLRKALQLSTMCKLQWEDTWENIIINTGLNYTWSNTYCIDLDQFIFTAYNIYSWNWNNWIINENTNLQDNSASFNDLIFSWYYNSVFIDSWHNISWLPNWNSWCTAYTVSNFYNNEKSTIEKISDSLTDFFGSGVAWIYNDTVWSHSTFSWLVSSLSVWTSGFFNSYLFDPYITQFNSWYNKFYSAVNLSGCSVIKQTFPDTIYWDIVFYVAIIWFILLFLKLL